MKFFPLSVVPHAFRLPRNASRAFALLAMAALIALAGCSDDDDEVLEITGTYEDDFGTMHVITGSTWTQTPGDSTLIFKIVSFNNGQDFLVAQNDASNAFNPDLFSRFDWTTFESKLYQCQIAFAEETAAAAEAVTTADRTEPTAGGCGGFTWTGMTKQ